MEKMIKVSGMHCKSCEMLLADVVCDVKGVDRVIADSKRGIVTLTARTPDAIESAKKAIENEGYRVIG